MVFWYLKVAKRVLNHRSKWGFQPLLLKRWTPNFYMKNERLERVSIWVKFRSLPLIFWYEEVFMEIRFYLLWFLEIECCLYPCYFRFKRGLAEINCFEKMRSIMCTNIGSLLLYEVPCLWKYSGGI